MYKMGPKNFLLPTLLLSLALLSGAVHGETLDLAVTPETAPSRLLAEAIPGNSTDRTWRLTGPPGRRLHLICTDLTLLKSDDCSAGFLSISENGAEEQKICERDSVYSRESVGNQLTVRIRTEPSSSGGRVSCEVLLVNGTVSGGSAQSAVTDTGEYLDGLGQHHTNTPDGGTNKKRIVGGVEVRRNSYPFMAVIQTSLLHMAVRCGGTILTKRHILTAAHCLDGYQINQLWVVVGAYNLTSDLVTGQTLAIQGMYPHDQYRPQGVQHDIAILHLDDDIDFNDRLRPVQPIFLPSERYQLIDNDVAAIGWGEMSPTGGPSTVLRAGFLHVVPLVECSNTRPTEVFYDLTQICTRALDGHQDTCKSDSGGPLIIRNPNIAEQLKFIQVGLISDKRNCEAHVPEQPGAWRLHTHLSHYVDWIQGIVSGTDPDLTCRYL